MANRQKQIEVTIVGPTKSGKSDIARRIYAALGNDYDVALVDDGERVKSSTSMIKTRNRVIIQTEQAPRK